MIEQLPADVAVALDRELRLGWELDRALAERRRKGVGKVNGQVSRSVDGLGELTARIDNIAYHYWGKRIGYECWADKQFLKEFLRDNPEARVRSHGTKLQVGYNGKHVQTNS
jgi:hypothetical protein